MTITVYPLLKIEGKFAFIGSDIITFKHSTDASFFIFDVSPSVRKASSEITSAQRNRFGKCEKNVMSYVSCISTSL